MQLQNEWFKVKIDEVSKAQVREKLIQCESIIDPQNLMESDLSKIFLVTVTGQNKSRDIVLIGDVHSMEEHCALLENDRLTVLMNDVIMQIRLTDCSLVRTKELEWTGCNFELHKIESDYLIYGEMYVVRLDRELEEVWEFSGADIFVSVTGKQAFELRTDTIRLHDFLDNFYEIDFAGKLIASHMV